MLANDSGSGLIGPINGQYYNLTDIYYNGTVIPSRDCTIQTCSLLIANFQYLPNAAGNYLFIILFVLLLLINIPLGFLRKTWGVLVGMFFGCALETIGYVGRIMARSNPFAFNPLLIYLICLTIGPAFMTAAIYLCLARIVVVYGEGSSRFKPRTYSLTFMFSDFVALVLQGVGGGIAATASGDNQNQAQMGIDIMIAGLVWQVVSLLLFSCACADFAWRVRHGKGRPNPSFLDLRSSAKWTGFLYALAIASLAIFVRSVYRVAELSQGFGGPIAEDEIPYMIFEPTVVFIAAFALTVYHPALVFGNRWREADVRRGNATSRRDELEMDKGYQGVRGTPPTGNSSEQGFAIRH